MLNFYIIAGTNQLAGMNTIYQPINGMLTPWWGRLSFQKQKEHMHFLYWKI